MEPADALLIVDVQQDFLPGGPLAVPDADAVIEPLNRCITAFEAQGLPIFATRDWHPPDHCSFIAQGGPWPDHCIRQTPGAAFAPGLRLPASAHVISKATQPASDAYSGFQGTDLAAQLRQRGCRRLFIGGLATDYCVAATAVDGRAAGFSVVVLVDAIRAVEVQPGDSQQALARMRASGASLFGVNEVLS